MRRRAHRGGVGPVPRRVLPRRVGVPPLRRPRGLPLPLGADPARPGARGLLGHGAVPRHPLSRLAVRVHRRDARLEVKPPEGDKASGLVESLFDTIEHFPGGWLAVTSTEKLFNWARKSSIWPVTFGLACCAIEMMATFASRFDVERFGMVAGGPPPPPDPLVGSGVAPHTKGR